jgi:hypothetical protein
MRIYGGLMKDEGFRENLNPIQVRYRTAPRPDAE